MAARSDLIELYARHIKPLPPQDRLQILAVIAQDLALDAAVTSAGERSLLELEGLGQRSGRASMPRSMSAHCAKNGTIDPDEAR
jgi:hypothetical protein